MDQNSRKSRYMICGKSGLRNSTLETLDLQEARNAEIEFKKRFKTVIFCKSTPTMTKGSIDEDIC